MKKKARQNSLGSFLGLRTTAQRGGEELLMMTKKKKSCNGEDEENTKVGIGLWATFILLFFLFRAHCYVLKRIKKRKKHFWAWLLFNFDLPIVSLLFRCGHAGDRVNIMNKQKTESKIPQEKMVHAHIYDHCPVHRHFNTSDMSIATESWWSWFSLFLSVFFFFLSFVRFSLPFPSGRTHQRR